MPPFARSSYPKLWVRCKSTAESFWTNYLAKTFALQFYKFCTSQKMTHLFGVDILTVKSHPQNWKTWDSDLFSDFNDVMSHFLLSLTSNKTVPDHFKYPACLYDHQTRRPWDSTPKVDSHSCVLLNNEMQHPVCYRRRLDKWPHPDDQPARKCAILVTISRWQHSFSSSLVPFQKC